MLDVLHLASTQLTLANVLDVTLRGFTGHEGVDHADIIHMNGRIYDPTLGRFLQADPHIQSPNNSQSYNRYPYVLNNPLSYTDPSGYFLAKQDTHLKNRLVQNSYQTGPTKLYRWSRSMYWVLQSDRNLQVLIPVKCIGEKL